jgi:hypothetical protein
MLTAGQRFQGLQLFHINWPNLPEGLHLPRHGYKVPPMPDFISKPDSNPDFRHMSPEALRQGVTVLNFLIRDLKKFQKSGITKCLSAWREGTKEAAQAVAVLPSAALVMRLADMPGPIDPAGAHMLGNHLVEEAEALRKKYKDIWRGRPRARFHDVSARTRREEQRRKANRWKFGR